MRLGDLGGGSGRVSFFSQLWSQLWNALPSFVQIFASKVYSRLYRTSFSRFFIRPFCWMHSLTPDYLSQFVSPLTQSSEYLTFQDFFTRKLKKPLVPKAELIWPCEGYICEQGPVSALSLVNIKGEWRDLRVIFGKVRTAIPDFYYFTNIFLHNQNYHRIHSPVSGTLERIERVPGALAILRPWFYPKTEISRPALTNERVNLDIRDVWGRIWHMSIVGGMAVGTIEILEKCQLKGFIEAGDELALFHLGSTCCLAAPVQLKKKGYLCQVEAGEKLDVQGWQIPESDFPSAQF